MLRMKQNGKEERGSGQTLTSGDPNERLARLKHAAFCSVLFCQSPPESKRERLRTPLLKRTTMCALSVTMCIAT